MALNLKAKETLIQVGKYANTYRYVLSPVIYNRLSDQKVIAEASIRSGINKGSLKAAWDAIGSVIEAWMTEGHSVAIPGLGTMRIGLKASSVSSVEKVSSSLISSRKVVFTPSVGIKKELLATSVSISCYDREGRLVKTVTSTDDQMGDYEVELIASPEQGGTLEGAGFYNEGDVALISAVPAEGYRFVKWDDDETAPQRSITVGEDVSLVATFRKVTDGAQQGSGSGSNGSGSDAGNGQQGSQQQGGGSGTGGVVIPDDGMGV